MTLYYSEGEDDIVTWIKYDDDEIERDDTPLIEPTRCGGENIGPPFHFPYNVGVYVLELTGEKYYVGMSGNLEQRMNEHWSGEGAIWTKKHPPVRVVTTYNVQDYSELESIEKRETIDRMEQYGVGKVRGAEWAAPDLDDCPLLPQKLRPSPDDDNLDEIAADLC